jgi:transposase-like protein
MPKRKSYTADFKLEACTFAEENGNCAAARKFSVDERFVREWRADKKSLEEMNPR